MLQRDIDPSHVKSSDPQQPQAGPEELLPLQKIISYFWAMCLLQSGPEQLPASRFALGSILGVYLVVAGISIVLGRQDIGPAAMLVSVVTGVLVQALTLYGVLMLKQVGTRFNPSMIGLLGTNSIIVVVSMAPALMLDATSDTLKAAGEVLFLLVFLWWLTIAGFIYHRAANISVMQGIILAFGVEMIVLSLTWSIIPVID